MFKKADILGGIFTRTDIKISVLISCCLVVIILLDGRFQAGINRKALSDTIYRKGKMISMLGAKSIGVIFDEAVDNNVLTLKEVFDSQYEPVSGSGPQSFHTKFDAYFEKAFLPIHETCLKEKNIIYARPIDFNGYGPLKGQTQGTDVRSAKSGSDSLAKQILEGERIKRATVSTTEGFVQEYISDAKERIWEISSPIFVKGQRWGTFCIGIKNMDQAGSGGGFYVVLVEVFSILFACAAVFGIVLTFLKPISGLTKLVNQVADGDVERSVGIKDGSDLGMLADAIERLRVSLKLSMARLAKK